MSHVCTAREKSARLLSGAITRVVKARYAQYEERRSALSAAHMSRVHAADDIARGTICQLARRNARESAE